MVAEPRLDLGKGASRRMRARGGVPGVVYGGKSEAVSIMVNQNELSKHLKHEAFHSHILKLKMGEQEEKVVLKDLQYHPYKTMVMHFDLQRVDESEHLTMRVPLHFINENICVGVKRDGGMISHIMADIEISCLPKHLPEYIEVDMMDVNIGEGVHLSDLNMPEGTQIVALLHGGDPKQVVASVHMPRVVKEPDTESAADTDKAQADTDKDDETDS